MTDELNEKSLREKFALLQPLYSRLASEVSDVLTSKLSNTGVDVVLISHRGKSVESFFEKISRKRYDAPFEQISDFAGVRVVCSYETDLLLVSKIIQENFCLDEAADRSHDLGVDRMGYHGSHFIVRLGDNYRGGRYESITSLKCEIQVRTVLQDAWAMISHQLVYKEEDAIPQRLRRDLNNVASLLEIAQGVFDSVREKREAYLNEIEQKKTESDPQDFLSQSIDFETLIAYTKWKFPELPVSENLTLRLLKDIDMKKYKNLFDLDQALNRAHVAVDVYKAQRPDLFKLGTDFLTKSLGFVDSTFEAKHPFAPVTREAFKQYAHLVKGR